MGFLLMGFEHYLRTPASPPRGLSAGGMLASLSVGVGLFYVSIGDRIFLTESIMLRSDCLVSSRPPTLLEAKIELNQIACSSKRCKV